MSASFIDSNILVYLAADDPAKAEKAKAVVGAGGVISVQVLNEFANVARRKLQLSWGETRGVLGALQELLTVHSLTVETHRTGLALAERYGFSVYDAMIVASALHADCATLLSEDMQDGLLLGERLCIVNPFRDVK